MNVITDCREGYLTLYSSEFTSGVKSQQNVLRCDTGQSDTK